MSLLTPPIHICLKTKIKSSHFWQLQWLISRFTGKLKKTKMDNLIQLKVLVHSMDN